MCVNNYLLQVENLSKFFPVGGSFFSKTKEKIRAVDGVSFVVEQGKTVGLVGESGCGKSTLGKTLLRLLEPDGGKVLFEGQDVASLSSRKLREIRKEMQIIFQDPFSSLNPRMSIQEILSEPFEIHGVYKNRKEREQRVKELIAEVGLHENALYKYPHEFSGGQRQRIGIARALALKPKLIIADEPVSALDVSIQSQILNLLMDLRDKYHLSYIFIAHDLAVIEHISDMICVMYLGKVMEYTSSHDLYNNPLHPYTQALIESIPKPMVQDKKRVQPTLLGDVPSATQIPTGCRFHTRCPKAQPICKVKEPPLERKQNSDHLVACHLVY